MEGEHFKALWGKLGIFFVSLQAKHSPYIDVECALAVPLQ